MQHHRIGELEEKFYEEKEKDCYPWLMDNNP